MATFRSELFGHCTEVDAQLNILSKPTTRKAMCKCLTIIYVELLYVVLYISSYSLDIIVCTVLHINDNDIHKLLGLVYLIKVTLQDTNPKKCT